MMNSTSSNDSTNSATPSEYTNALQAIYMSHTVYIVIGTFLNLWLILSILTSKELRERFRNQLICNMAILHLTESLIKSPVIIAFILKMLTGKPLENACYHVATISNTERIQSFIVDWLLVFLVVTFLAQVLDLDPTNKLTAPSLRIGKVILHILPWITALVVTPSLVYFYRGKSSCLSAPYLSHYVFTAINTLAPIVLSILLTMMASVLNFLKRRSWTSNMGTHLIDGARDVDTSLAYIAAVVTSVTCEIFNVAFSMYLKINLKLLGIGFEAAAIVLSDSRVIFMVFPWLLLRDIRDRIRTWRPWYSPSPGIDLTVAYDKEAQ